MGMWEILEEGRGEYDRDFGMRGGNPMEEAYREGCRHGSREPCVRCRAVKWAIVTAVVHAVEAIAAAQIWANAVCWVTSRNIRFTTNAAIHSLTVMIWANADADAPTESSCNGEGIIPLFCQSLKIRKI